MQRIASSLMGLTLILLVIFSTGCDPDSTGGGGTMALPPTISLSSDAGFVSFDQDVPLATPTFSVRINVNDGDNPLNTLTITQDGTTMPFDNLVFDGGATTAQNPFLITGADQSGTTYDVEITPVAPVANVASTFNFTVSDGENRVASESLTLTFTSAPPVFTLGANGLTADSDVSTISPGFNLQVVASVGDATLTSVAFYEDGVLMDEDDISVQVTGSNITENPFLLGNIATYDEVFTINVGDDAADGPRTYTVDVTDALGVTTSQSVTVTYVTPEVTLLSGILLNQGGGTGTGGLDLDNGTGTGSGSMDAEIQDEGIDTDIIPANNWRQQISAANDAVMRVVDLTALPDNYSFDNVTTLAEVRDAFTTGTVPSGDDSNCNCSDSTNGEEVSDRVMVGDLFAIERDGNYYLIRVDEVNVTNSDNDDNYVLSIKK